MATESAKNGGEGRERLLLGGMAHWSGINFFGPTYSSLARRKEDGIYIWIDPTKAWRPKGALGRVSKWPVARSIFFWGSILLQLAGSIWALLFFVGIMAVLWLLVVLLEAGTESIGGSSGAALGLLADFPILPILLLFFAGMKFTSLGRYHGAEHKAVAAYEKYGDVVLEGARKMSRIHPRCGTNILIYIILAALLDPFIDWAPYAILQFILVSEAWFVFGKSRLSIALGNQLQRYFTTAEPGMKELEVAVESLRELLRAEARERGSAKAPTHIPAKY